MSAKAAKKGKKIQIKKIKTVDELEGICDFIRDHIHSILSTTMKPKHAEQSERDFSDILHTLQAYYFHFNSDCQKNATQSLVKFHRMLLEFLKDTTNRPLLMRLFKERAALTTVIVNCIRQLSSQTLQLEMTDAERVQTLIKVLLKNIKPILSSDEKIYSSPSQTTKWIAILQDITAYELERTQIGIILPILNIYSNEIENVFERITIDPEIKNFIFKLLSLWKQNYRTNIPHMNEHMLADCALLILKRILLVCVLFLEGDLDTSILRLRPTLSELNTMIKNAYKAPQTTRYRNIIERLRAKWKSGKPPSQRTRSFPATEQQIRTWQKNVGQFLQSLEQENRKLSSPSQTIPTTPKVSRQEQQEKKQQKKMPTTMKQTLQQIPFTFQYVSPGFRHRQSVEDAPLQWRKTQNIPDVQMSLVDGNLPGRVMDLALKGNHTSILLVDVANKKRQFPSQEQMRTHLRQLVPADIPTRARRKPLFVLVEQADLDASLIPKASLDDRLLKKGILQIKVSCVKQTDDGRRLDCYKKQTGQDFTKNPMDDFVLLTLRHTLRSYYYNYMRHWGKDVKFLKKLETFQQLLSDNPFQVLLQQEQWGQVVRQSYEHVHFDENVPYTWLISDDRWGDWTRHRK